MLKIINQRSKRMLFITCKQFTNTINYLIWEDKTVTKSQYT